MIGIDFTFIFSIDGSMILNEKNCEKVGQNHRLFCKEKQGKYDISTYRAVK